MSTSIAFGRMNIIIQIYVLFFCSLAFLSGCAEWRSSDIESVKVLEPVVVYPSFSSNYLLSCLSDMQSIERKKFDMTIESAEADLVYGRDRDKLYFVCLSLNEKADYKKFKHGSNVLAQYFQDHPDLGKDMQGFRILVDRLDEEIMNRWSAWKSLLNDKKELIVEVESLQVKINEQQKQIDQLKNIENIINGRETNQHE